MPTWLLLNPGVDVVVVEEEEEGSGVVSVRLLCVKGSIPQCVIKYVFIMLSKSMA